MRYYLIAGERSGDLHGGTLVQAILAVQPDAEILAWGGDAIRDAGATLVKHISETAFMGFLEVVQNLSTIRANFALAKKTITDFRPDVVIFIDYPGFNLRMARWCKQHNYTTAYFIPPKVWAWKESRVKKIKKYIDLLLVIFPFEVDYYEKHGIAAHYVGNPSKNAVDAYRKTLPPKDRSSRKLALFPGSRNQEVRRMLPIMMEAAAALSTDYEIIVSGVSNVDAALYPSGNQVIMDDSYEIFAQCDLAIVKSGTVTLEAALFEVPQVVCYVTSPLSYSIAKRFVKISYISLPNILLDRPFLKELIQNEMNTPNITRELQHILNNKQYVLEGHHELHTLLGNKDAATEAARLIIDMS